MTVTAALASKVLLFARIVTVPSDRAVTRPFSSIGAIPASEVVHWTTGVEEMSEPVVERRVASNWMASPGTVGVVVSGVMRIDPGTGGPIGPSLPQLATPTRRRRVDTR